MYKLPFDIAVFDATGKHIYPVVVDEVSETIELPFSGQLKGLIFDYEQMILAPKRENKPAEFYIHEYYNGERYSARKMGLMEGSRDKSQLGQQLIIDALNDDLNTPEALGIFFDFISKMNKNIDNELMTEDLKVESKIFINLFNSIFSIINTSLSNKDSIPKNIQDLASLREEMRNKSEWNEADKLRGKIENLGWLIEDTKDGQKLIQKK